MRAGGPQASGGLRAAHGQRTEFRDGGAAGYRERHILYLIVVREHTELACLLASIASIELLRAQEQKLGLQSFR